MTYTDPAGDQPTSDSHEEIVAGGPNPLAGQGSSDAYNGCVGEDQPVRTGQARTDPHSGHAGADLNSPDGHILSDTQSPTVIGGYTPEPAIPDSIPVGIESVRGYGGDDQNTLDAQATHVVAPTSPTSPTSPAPTTPRSVSTDHALRRETADGLAPAKRLTVPTGGAPVLADPLLALTADVLDDLERVRIANQNRLRQLTRTETDSDGEERGFGLSLDHPDVARLADLVDALGRAEHDAELNLKRVLRKHPLGPWIQAQHGIGEKQGARLLAAIGDPYIRPEMTRKDGTVEPARPRTVPELWAFCGYHIVPADQARRDTQVTGVGGAPTSAAVHNGRVIHSALAGGGINIPTDHVLADTQGWRVGGDLNGSGPDQPADDDQGNVVGVAAHPRRGVRVNWSPTARSRARLIADSIVKAGGPYREIYDRGRLKYADAIHHAECKRCGPSGSPALVGSPLSLAHQDARARRLVVKAVLKQFWCKARRIHKEEL